MEKCIHQLIEEQAQRNPDKCAVIFENSSISYKELNDKANQIAWFLICKGVYSEECVGICMDRSIDMIISLLGILKAGCAYVPFGLENPKNRVVDILSDSKINIILTDGKFDFSFITTKVEIVNIFIAKDAIEKEQQNNLNLCVDLNSLMYVLFTSGSTGKPKGTLIRQKGLVSLIKTLRNKYNFCHEDIWTQFHSYTFDFSVWEIWTCLVTGGCLVIIPKEMTHSPIDFWMIIVKRKVTIVSLTPSSYRQLFYNLVDRNLIPIRLFFCCGELFPIDLLPVFRKLNISVLNCYGPTEATVYATIYEVEFDTDLVVVPIGKPIGETYTYILDESMKPVPIDQEGEIFIGGPGIAKGYLNQPELTTERFIDDPFFIGAEKKIYKTGDVGKLLKNGDLIFLGRKDDQIKIRGYRVELGEIEAAIRRSSLVNDVAVIQQEDKNNSEKQIIAYVVPGDMYTRKELWKYLDEHLLKYMIPSLIIEKTELPRTNAEKIDKKALYEINANGIHLVRQSPRSEIEKGVEDIWKELLKLEEIDIQDNFFYLGGNSLKITRMIARIIERFNVKITYRKVFKNPTIEGVAKVIEDSVSKPAIC